MPIITKEDLSLKYGSMWLNCSHVRNKCFYLEISACTLIYFEHFNRKLLRQWFVSVLETWESISFKTSMHYIK